MVTLDPELQALKSNLLEMFELTKEQLEQCLEAIETADEKATKKVIKREKRINSLDINIDRDCENILALHSPVATDLRFVLATLKISSSLERIGDNSKSLAKYIRSNIKKDNLEILEQFNIKRMLQVTISMMEEMGTAIAQEKVEIAKQIAEMDDEINESTKKAFKISRRLIKEDAKTAGLVLKTYTIIRRIERIGDYIKNIGEEVVFHLEARVTKHGMQR
jgi:phosphate transport system protein